MVGQKHAIKCRCILPQFKKRKDPIFHEFVVFSTCDDDENFNETFVQCNNCGIVHKVYDFCKSEIIDSKESLRSVQTIDDISISLDQDIVQLLESSNADLATYQELSFTIENQIYDKKILLEKENVDDYVVGKFVTLLKNGRLKVEPFHYQLGIKK